MLSFFDTLERGEPVQSPEALRPLLGDVGDHARRLPERTMMVSEALEGLLNANLARGAVRKERDHPEGAGLGRDRRRGHQSSPGSTAMDLRHMPELDWPFGYPAALGILLFTIFVLRWNFRRVGWL